MDDFAEKIRSVNFGSARRRAPKVTTDHHDDGATVDVVEHWDDRQDVIVHPKTVAYGFGRKEG